MLSGVFNMLGALLVGTAVADTIAGIVTVSPAQAVAVIGSGVLAATVWNVLTWWRGLPSSSGHALVGGLVGSALAEAGLDAVNWGGLDGWKPVGVLGVLIALAVSPLIGLVFGFAFVRLSRLALRRARRGVHRPIRAGQWAMSAALSFSHGANDGQKAMGVIVALLLAEGRLDTFSVPLWVKLACGATLTLGTAMGGWTDRPHDRPADLPPDFDRRLRQPGRLDRGDPRLLVRRSARVDDPGRRLLGDRRRRRAAALAARPLGRRAVDGVRLVAHASRSRDARCRYLAGLEGDRMRPRHWFLPQMPDVLGMLREQIAITVEGMDALVAWANGDPAAAQRLRDCEHRADDIKREIRAALTVAFTTPLEPEDIFELSRELDRTLNSAKNTVREAEVMETSPDAAIAQMAAELAQGMRDLAEGFAALGHHGRRATEASSEAARSQSRLEKAYRQAMSGLVTVDDLREVAAKRELYRRLARTSDELREVAERVWYSVLKES